VNLEGDVKFTGKSPVNLKGDVKFTGDLPVNFEGGLKSTHKPAVNCSEKRKPTDFSGEIPSAAFSKRK
jgi:hypothetical protein